MECFPIKGNGHPVIDRELYTRCSHPTYYTCLLRRGLVLQTFFHIVPLADSGHQIFLPELYLVHPRIPCPKHHSRVGAMKKHRGLCGSAEWPKLPLHLGVVGR